MAARQLPDQFLAAFSFAGEQRDLVRAIATELEATLGEGTVFFDEWWPHYLAGGDADLKLQDVYSHATVVVVCVSEEYGDKAWTRTENEAIRARAMEAQHDRDEVAKFGVLPIRVADGDVPGIGFNTIAPDVRTWTARESAEFVVDRLGLLGALTNQGAAAATAGFRTHRVSPGDTVERIATRYLGSPARWRQIADTNRLYDPVALQPGQLLEIPEVGEDDER